MGQYWPEENEECECGPFIIEAMSVDRQVPDITARELKLTYQPTVCFVIHNIITHQTQIEMGNLRVVGKKVRESVVVNTVHDTQCARLLYCVKFLHIGHSCHSYGRTYEYWSEK